MRSIENLIMSGNLAQATSMLNSMTPDRPNQLRWQNHMRAKILLFSGKYTESLELLLSTRQDYGDHLALLCDIGTIQFLMNNLADWRLTVGRIESAFNDPQVQISLDSFCKTALSLGKFFENLGRISDSIDVYEKLLTHPLCRDLKMSFKCRVISQKLRLQVVWGDSQVFLKTYEQLHLMISQSEGLVAIPEIEHALCLAQFEIYGFETVELQLAQIEKKQVGADYRLVLFDLIEMVYRRKQTVPQAWRYRALQISDPEGFERILIELVKGKSQEFEINSNELSELAFLRAKGFSALFLDDQKRGEILSKLVLDCKRFTIENRSYWQKLFTTLTEAVPARACLYLNLKKKALFLNSDFLDLQTEDFSFRALKVLSGALSMPTQQLVLNLWEVEMDEINFQRTLIGIRRLNKLAQSKLGVVELVRINKTSTTLMVNVLKIK